MTAAAWVQAVATVVLVAVTAVYVRLTGRGLKAAQASSSAAERGLVLNVAPIILPRRTVGSGAVTGSLHNIGGRPAIEVEMEILLGETRVGQHTETLIRPGEQKNWKIVYDPNQTGILGNAPFIVTCTYQAMTGEGFRTTKRYRRGERHEFEVFFQEGDDYQRLSITKGIDDDS